MFDLIMYRKDTQKKGGKVPENEKKYYLSPFTGTAMKVYIFRCGTTLLWGVTESSRGANLPSGKCTDWKYFGHIEIDPNGILPEDLNEIITEVEYNGFWIGGGTKTQFSEWTEKN